MTQYSQFLTGTVHFGFRLALVFLILAATTQTSIAQTETEEIEKSTAHLLIVDPDGEPIPGAKATAYAFKSNARPNSHSLWQKERMGPPPSAQANEQGEITVEFAKQYKADVPVSIISWQITHLQHVPTTVHLDVTLSPGKIVMQRGFRVMASAIDSTTKEKVTENLFAFQSSVPTKDWSMKNGFLASPVFGEEQTGLRLVHVPSTGRMMFTDLLPVPTDKGKSNMFMRDCELHPGVRVEGRLADDIPRPIKNGMVNACIVSEPDGGSRESRWMWFEKAKINEDGTFVFESLPKGDVLQMTPVCDGWIPTNPTDAAAYFGEAGNNIDAGTSFPQMVRLDSDTVTPVLNMHKCATLNVTILDPEGKPLSGAQIFSSPNQYFFNLGSMLLGEGDSYIEYLSRLQNNKERPERSEPEGRFFPKTLQDGLAILPIPFPGSEIQVWHEDYELPDEDEGLLKASKIKLGETLNVTFRLIKKEDKKNKDK